MAGTPARRAAHAKALPWFPELGQTTPASRCASLSCGFGYFTQGDRAMVQFSKNDKVIKFTIQMPDRKSDEIALTDYGYNRSAAAACAA